MDLYWIVPVLAAGATVISSLVAVLTHWMTRRRGAAERIRTSLEIEERTKEAARLASQLNQRCERCREEIGDWKVKTAEEIVSLRTQMNENTRNFAAAELRLADAINHMGSDFKEGFRDLGERLSHMSDQWNTYLQHQARRQT